MTQRKLSRAEKKRRERMRGIVERFQKYVASYSDQLSYEEYSDDMFIQDMVYGIGIALDPEGHAYANGYRAWRIKLRKMLSDVPPTLGDIKKAEKP